jgi:excisionase family DNA binding protein
MVTGMLLTPEEAASQLAIGRTKVYELIREGKLESVRIGTCRRIPAQSLRTYVTELLRLEMDVMDASTSDRSFRVDSVMTRRRGSAHLDEPAENMKGS